MLYPLRDRLLVVALALVATGPAMAENMVDMRGALASATGRNWAEAQDAANRSGPVAQSLIAWQKLRAGQGSWPEYRDFARAHPDYPGMDLFYQRGDAVLTKDLPAADVIAWFGARRPDTLNGLRAYVAALGPDQAKVDAELRRFWTEIDLGLPEETSFLTDYSARVAPVDAARMTRLLDQGKWVEAQQMIGRLSPADQALARARIALQSGGKGVDTLILALPAAQQGDAGLALDRFRWRVKNKMGDLARDLMLERSTSAEALRDPSAWAALRADYARADLRAGNWARAERFAANHFLPRENKNFTDLEWLAGYAAFRAGANDRALTHFRQLETAGATPITLSRSLYWQGRAEAARGDAAAAEAAYAKAAKHQTAYYGQLAAEKVGGVMEPALAVTGRAEQSLPDWRGSILTENLLWQAGVWLTAAGYPEQGQRFFMQIAETAEPEDIGRMARLMLEMRQPWSALRLAKAAAAKGAIYPAAYFPLTGLEGGDHGVPPEMVLSIARRESEFDHRVTSHSGAKGLMQVMPGTARDMAAVLGEPYEFARLTSDPSYNARLGAAYLRGLEDRFGRSSALVSSGYNAGPGRSARWIKDFGDLRRHADPVDWVEMIPLDETRNYVMRVTESLPIYRARISGKPAPIVPSFDLTGGGIMPAPPPPPIRLWASARPPISMRMMTGIASGGALRAALGGEVAIAVASSVASTASGDEPLPYLVEAVAGADSGPVPKEATGTEAAAISPTDGSAPESATR